MRNGPTPETFTGWLRYHLDKTVNALTRETTEFVSQWSGKGALGNGRLPVVMFDEKVEPGFERGIDLAFSILQRAKRVSGVGQETLRNCTESELRRFLSRVEEMRSQSA
jgi:hypothetical protein